MYLFSGNPFIVKLEDCAADDKAKPAAGEGCALQAEATSLRFGGETPQRANYVPSESDRGPAVQPVQFSTGFESVNLFSQAYRQLTSDLKAGEAARNPDAYSAAFRANESKFDNAVLQSEREYGTALLGATMRLGLRDATPLLNAAKEYNQASDGLGRFASGKTDAEVNRDVAGLKRYFELDPSSAQARQIKRSLPEGMIEATQRFNQAAQDPVFQEYSRSVAPTVINRIQMLQRYDEILGAAGATEKQRASKAQLDGLMRNN